MPKIITEVLEDKKLVISTLFFKALKDLHLTLNEFMVLFYFDNELHKAFDLKTISKALHLNETESFEAFNGLLSKNLIALETKNDADGRMTEVISLKKFYELVDEMLNENIKKDQKQDIYKTFETEFGRPISSMEYEIINAWLNNGTTEELILGALKEAIYNGVNNFRYIDKIIYEWGRKGFKTMEDVNLHLTKRKEKKETETELFDYNWLDEDE